MPLARGYWFDSLLAIVRKVLSNGFQGLEEGEVAPTPQKKGGGEERANKQQIKQGLKQEKVKSIFKIILLILYQKGHIGQL